MSMIRLAAAATLSLLASTASAAPPSPAPSAGPTAAATCAEEAARPVEQRDGRVLQLCAQYWQDLHQLAAYRAQARDDVDTIANLRANGALLQDQLRAGEPKK